jgi:hypothetical protein
MVRAQETSVSRGNALIADHILGSGFLSHLQERRGVQMLPECLEFTKALIPLSYLNKPW